MTERQAWLRVAEIFRDRDCPTGICSAIHGMWAASEIDIKLKIKMLQKIHGWGVANHKNFRDYYWPMWEAGPRIQLARRFAAELKGKR